MESNLEMKSNSTEQLQAQKQLVTRPRILVVEDDMTQEPFWDYIIERAAEKAIVSWATSVAEADEMIFIAQMEGAPFDLVISDIFLSGSLTGIDLWQRFNHQLNGNFLLISSIDPMNLQKHLAGLGAPIYIQKPLNVHETIETIYGLLQRPTY